MADRLAEDDEVAVRGEDQELSLAVGLIQGTVHVIAGKVGEPGPELRQESIQILHIDVVPEGAVAGHQIRVIVSVDADTDLVPLHEGVVATLERYGKAETIAEEGNGRFQLTDVHEGRDLHEVGHD